MRTHKEYMQMNLLNHALRVLFLVSLVVLVGCDKDKGGGLPFSHKHHIEEEELKCENCHTGADKGQPTKPVAKTCMKCHEGSDAKKPPEKRLAAHLVNGELPANPATKSMGDVKFNHESHIKGKLTCVTCHGDVAKSKSLSGKMTPKMKDCVTCHSKIENVNVKNNCAYCHKVIRRDVAPQDHKSNWKQLHGKAVGFMTKDSAERCETCHTQEWCLRCHRQEKPKSHTNYWRSRGHNVQAELDRQSCKVCHQPDFCVRCHRSVAPNVVHAFEDPQHANWTNEAYCFRCHFRSSGMVAPHRNPGWVHCLQCHRVRGKS